LQLLICGQSHSLCVEFSLKDVLSTAATIGNIQPDNISILKDGKNQDFSSATLTLQAVL
jgi:hypothetical protein